MADTTNTTAAPAATQPEALRLADALQDIINGYDLDRDDEDDLAEAMVELRRLHALSAAPAAQEAEPVAYCQPDDPNPSEAFSWPGHCKQEHHTIPLYAHPPRLQVAEAVDAPEGCTPADARILRQANHDLAAESFELQAALRGIAAQADKVLARFDIAAAPQAPAAGEVKFSRLDEMPLSDETYRAVVSAAATPAPAAAVAPTAAPTQEAAPLTRDQIRDVFLAHGFTVKEGQTDLKEYVYAAAEALLAAANTQEAEDAAPPTVQTSPKNTGHGHVFPRPDGMKARCGGPGLCSQCSIDAARARQEGAQHER